MEIAKEIQKGNKRAAARLISMIENQDKEAAEILKECWSSRSESRVIGITGPPGSGKSTLTDQLAKFLLKQQKKIGIIAVDPTSPITGGAFLGDRVRMSDLNGKPHVFIRSMGTRGALGGISRAVRGAVRVMEVFGMDYIFVETVGVGQSEVDVAGLSDTVVLVTVPGLGDEIQTEKAGILEVADVIVVNKADRDGADQAVNYLRSLLYYHDNSETGGAAVQIVKTAAAAGLGIEALLSAIEDHHTRMTDSGKTDRLRRERLKSELIDLTETNFRNQFHEFDICKTAAEKSVENILSADADPYSEADRLMQDFIEWRLMNVKEDRSSGNSG